MPPLPLLAAFALALAGGAVAQRPGEPRAFVQPPGEYSRPALAWCDAPGAVLALSAPAGGGYGELLVWPRGGAVQRHTAWVGRRAGGGIPFAWRAGGERPALGRVEGNATAPQRFVLAGREYRCRSVRQAEFVGSTGARTVTLWHVGDRITLDLREPGGSAVQIPGGRVAWDDIGPEYTFRQGNTTYLLKFHPYTAFLQIRSRGTLREEARFVAYSYRYRDPARAGP